MSKKEDTVTTVTSLDSTATNTASTHNRSHHEPTTSTQQTTLGVPATERQDFPSPGSAPEGHNIFDANAVAEERGVETVPGGWAEGVREQEKLADEYAAQDGEKKGLKEKMKDFLHRD